MDKIKESIEELELVIAEYEEDIKYHPKETLSKVWRKRIPKLQTLIDIAKRVDSAEMPQKKEEKDYPKGEWQTLCDNETYIEIASGNYNQALEDCKLYLAKREHADKKNKPS